MQVIKYAFIFAIVFLVFKALFFDDYIAQHYTKNIENNISGENNISSPAPVQPEPKTEPIRQENNISVSESQQQETSEDKKMPLERLGDTISKYIKL
ncbi:MAG: hypothetical protein CJD30_07315 [Sulfuricurvum sp. PD_MW2]|jgi:hypothetical protein|uniref:hypothetical protein n=1 Tax=Sulfuricurvum sp. PD_MW2 TaxID=2027917 RepID=UPI000C05E193|nr:hypothetical protein [Sulfuricurvum sp. PD_MW2]PHM17307.1 MAG: hypothetical protein CJD30_07315 [Sulfuricurvum sp. PD_MW2]